MWDANRQFAPGSNFFLPHCVILCAIPDCHPHLGHRHCHNIAVAANPPRLTAVQTGMLSRPADRGQLESEICVGNGGKSWGQGQG